MQIVGILNTIAPPVIGRNLEIYGFKNVPLSILEPNGLYLQPSAVVCLGPSTRMTAPTRHFQNHVATPWRYQNF